jgi:hypothetical protein
MHIPANSKHLPILLIGLRKIFLIATVYALGVVVALVDAACKVRIAAKTRI